MKYTHNKLQSTLIFQHETQ